MAQAPGTLSQPCLSVYNKVGAGSTIEVRDADGADIISTVTPKDCESLIFSSKDFHPGSSYSIYADDILLATVTATDGVSGDGAAGSGSGTWNQDGGSWVHSDSGFGSNKDFTHPDRPADISATSEPVA